MWTKNNIPDQTGKTVIVTGANAGIGFETASALYQAGALVVLACRNLENAEKAIARIQEQAGKGSLEAAVLDLSSLKSVKEFAELFIQKHQQLHILINNAGVMTPPESKSSEGFELQFGVNFIGHFALTGYLYPLLNSTPGSRIVTLSSGAYLNGQIDFENLKSEKSYEPAREYAQSKLADLLFTIELQRRITASKDQVISIAAHPGAVQTELIRHMTKEDLDAALARFGSLMDAEQGALTSLYAAVSTEVIAGAYYTPDQDGVRGYPMQADIAPNAMDETVALTLWTLAEKATGIHFPM